MDIGTFKEELQASPRPVVVEFWAPWCMPCKTMEPGLEKASREFEGLVDFRKINADENPDLLRSHGIMGIPTMMGFAGGEELFRVTGALNSSQITQLFSAAREKQKLKSHLSSRSRLYRMLIGFAIMILGWISGYILVVLLGAGVAFSAVYDRCPIYQSVAPRINQFFAGLIKKKENPGIDP